MGHRDGGQGATALVSTLPQTGGGTQAPGEDCHGGRARARGLRLGGAPTGPGAMKEPHESDRPQPVPTGDAVQ